MSDPKTPPPKGEEAKGDSAMSDADSKFLIECLKNTKGTVTVDLDAVASALDYSNPKSVGNRLSTLKKKYGLALTTTAATSKNAGDVAGSPIKPDKVKKPRTPSKKTGDGARRKKVATPKKGKKASGDSDNDDAVKAKGVEEEDVKGKDEAVSTNDTETEEAEGQGISA